MFKKKKFKYIVKNNDILENLSLEQTKEKIKEYINEMKTFKGFANYQDTAMLWEVLLLISEEVGSLHKRLEKLESKK